MQRNHLIVVLLACWTLAFAGSFLTYATTAPEDMGFTRGLNRIGAFLTWQAVAGALGLTIWLQARGLADASPLWRWMLRIPALLALLLLLGLAGLIGYGLLAPDPA